MTVARHNFKYGFSLKSDSWFPFSIKKQNKGIDFGLYFRENEI
jgi:hypothetical protein